MVTGGGSPLEIFQTLHEISPAETGKLRTERKRFDHNEGRQLQAKYSYTSGSREGGFNFMAEFAPYAYALLRIISGLLFICHGAQKVFGLFGGMDGAPAQKFSMFWNAGVIELVLGTLITIGFLAGVAAFIASGEMAVAYFIGHFPKSFWPLENAGEPAVLFCFIFLYIATQGAGLWSVDAASTSRRRRMFR